MPKKSYTIKGWKNGLNVDKSQYDVSSEAKDKSDKHQFISATNMFSDKDGRMTTAYPKQIAGPTLSADNNNAAQNAIYYNSKLHVNEGV